MTDQFEPWRIVMNRRTSNASYYAKKFTQENMLESAEFWTSVEQILNAIVNEIEHETNYATYIEGRS